MAAPARPGKRNPAAIEGAAAMNEMAPPPRRSIHTLSFTPLKSAPRPGTDGREGDMGPRRGGSQGVAVEGCAGAGPPRLRPDAGDAGREGRRESRPGSG